MATRSAHFYETPEHHSGADYRGRQSAYRNRSEPTFVPKRRSRVGTVLIAVAGAVVGFSAIMLAARTTDEPTLSATPMTPSREPAYTLNPAYEQTMLMPALQTGEASGDQGATASGASMSGTSGDSPTTEGSSSASSSSEQMVTGGPGQDPGMGSSSGTMTPLDSGARDDSSTQRWINSARPGTDINQQPPTGVDATDPMFPRIDDTASDVAPNRTSPTDSLRSPSSTTDDNPY